MGTGLQGVCAVRCELGELFLGHVGLVTVTRFLGSTVLVDGLLR